MENLGFLAALGAALFWGSYIVPFKKSPAANLIQFQALMSVGIFIFGLVASMLLGFSLHLNIYGIVGGLMWALGNVISLKAVSDIGMSRALPIWISVVILVSFLWGAIVFNELSTGLILGVLGIALIIAGVILVGSIGNAKNKNSTRGLLLSIVSGALFGSQLVPLKLVDSNPASFFFPMSLGILLFGIGFLFIKRVKIKNEAIINSLFSGLLWNMGNLLSIVTVSLIGLAKGFPLTQTSVLVAVLWGVFYFKEITQRKQMIQVLTGAVILLAGVAVLGLA